MKSTSARTRPIVHLIRRGNRLLEEMIQHDIPDGRQGVPHEGLPWNYRGMVRVVHVGSEEARHWLGTGRTFEIDAARGETTLMRPDGAMASCHDLARWHCRIESCREHVSDASTLRTT